MTPKIKVPFEDWQHFNITLIDNYINVDTLTILINHDRFLIIESWYLSLINKHLGHIMSVHPLNFAPRNLKLEVKVMKQDKDLAFLDTCQNDDLRTLCDILTYNNKGELRLSEQLTNTDAYLNCYPDKMNLMAAEIAEELRKFGSNTVMTICRKGEADSYETIVRRVCKKMGVNVNDSDNTLAIERELLTTICEQTTSKLSDEELRKLADKAGIPHKSLNHQMLVSTILFAIRRNTYLLTEMIYYVTSRIASMLLGRWIGMMGMSAVSRYLGMAAGPIGWALLAGWTLSDIASPAHRVMIPAVIMVASMRFRQTALLTQKI